MRIGNITMLIAALICATAAALLSRAWLRDQAGEQRVLATQQEMLAPATRSIVVAARDLKNGEKLSADAMRVVSWPVDTLPKGVFASLDTLVKPGQERTVLGPIAENEPILEGKLYGAGGGTLTGKLASSMNAVTIRVNDVAGVAGFVQPDDRVDVFLTTGGRASDGAAAAEKPSVVVLMQNVRVLATDQASERKGQASPPKAVTLEVNTADAQKLVLASTIGQLSLALRRYSGDAESEPRPIAADDLMAKQPILETAKSGQVVGVTRAAERHEYTVQPEQPKYRRSEAVR
jgi:pilus assembly protein CpaB